MAVVPHPPNPSNTVTFEHLDVFWVTTAFTWCLGCHLYYTQMPTIWTVGEDLGEKKV
jgi:hypothetical protein